MNKATINHADRFHAWDNPPPAFRPAILWSWNGDMTAARIKEMLEGFAQRDFGGVFIHPRPGLVTEYLSEEWFSLWAVALEECRRLGLGCHIYDENSFPSGFAGGHVVAENPLAANSRLTGRWVLERNKTEAFTNGRLALLTRDSAKGLDPAAAASPEVPLLSINLESFPASLWKGGFPMADVCRAEVTAQFLASTHAAYAERFSGEFGEAIRYVFTDEPETGTSAKGFHMSRSMLLAFRAEHGYPLESRLADLCGSGPESPAVRHDYFVTLNRLFTENFSRLVSDWCRSHRLAFTGHFLENQWPFPQGCPSTMAAQRWMQAPGLDLLGFQFTVGTVRDNALWLLAAKEATSIAAQCGQAEVLCESCGGGGYNYGPAEMKPVEDFLLALGVNRLVPHLSHETLAGARKYDWPQTISDHSPWWDAFGVQARHVARANYLLSQGTESSRTLVLQPTTTGWLHYRPDCFHWPDESPNTVLKNLQISYTALLSDLYSGGVDFDLGDECVMAELGDVTNDNGTPGLRIGARTYQTVVIPAGLENMLSSTVRILGDFLAAGGKILSAGEPPTFIDGRPSPFPLGEQKGWERAGDNIVASLRHRHPPRLTSPDGSGLPADLLWRYSGLPGGGAIVFFANPTSLPLMARIRVGSGTAFDTFTGQRSALETESSNVNLTLSPGGHALWHVDVEHSIPPLRTDNRNASATTIPAEFRECMPMEANLLALDYCDYSGPDTSLANRNTIHADTANWHAHGFDQNLWRVSIQYRKTFLEAAIPTDSGFRVRFVFHTSDEFAASDHAAGLHVAVERPWLYEVLCNGAPLSQENAISWFDEETRLLPLGSTVVGGENVIELHAHRFHVLAEIMPIFLRGQFRLTPHAQGFLMEAPLPWENGTDWSAEGYPFYPWRARYQFAFCTSSPGSLRITMPEFSGSAAGIQVDDSPLVWAFQKGQVISHPDLIPAGDHRLDILLCGDLKNLLGPHFHDGLPGAWSWENCPPTQPPGERYRFSRTGLAGPPRLEIFTP